MKSSRVKYDLDIWLILITMGVFSRGLKRGIQASDTGYFTAASMSIMDAKNWPALQVQSKISRRWRLFGLPEGSLRLNSTTTILHFRDSPSRVGVRELETYGRYESWRLDGHPISLRAHLTGSMAIVKANPQNEDGVIFFPAGVCRKRMIWCHPFQHWIVSTSSRAFCP